MDANLVKQLDELDELNLLLDIHHGTAHLPHAPQQTAAHTKIKLCRFSQLKVLVTLERTNANIKRRDPEGAEGAGAAGLQDDGVALEDSHQKG
ncbi:MAG: hypothetical protein WBK51_08460 [Polaromonas sp.]